MIYTALGVTNLQKAVWDMFIVDKNTSTSVGIYLNKVLDIKIGFVSRSSFIFNDFSVDQEVFLYSSKIVKIWVVMSQNNYKEKHKKKKTYLYVRRISIFYSLNF